ncbi:MAG TPA: type II/IV secretion system protein [Candidatus Obscuribacterales bacterium]
MKKQSAQTKPTSILGLIARPELESEMAAALGHYDFRPFQSVEAALEAIYTKYYIPDLVLLCLPEDEARRFCDYFMADLHLALVPVVLIQETLLGKPELKQMGVTEALSFPLTPEQLLSQVHKHESTRRKWWKSLHVYAAERPESVLKALNLDDKKSNFLDRDHDPQLSGHRVRSETFPRFKEFLFQRLDYSRDRAKYLQNYCYEQVYDLGMALFLDSFQLAGHLADFFELKTITNLDSYELVIGAMPDQFCRRNLVLPLLDEAGRQCVAIPNPFQLEVLDMLDKIFKSYELLIAPPELIEDVLNPDFHNTDRYRQWQALRHVRSGIPRDQLSKVRLELLDAPAHSVVPHNPPPAIRSRMAQVSFPSLEDLVNAADTVPSNNGRRPIDTQPVKHAINTEDRMSRAHQAYLDQKAGDELLSISPYASLDSAERDLEDAPIIHMVNCLIEKGHDLGASDIHIEPWEDEVVVRYRIDGMLKVVHRMQPQAMIRPIVTRLKIMSNMDVSEKRLPQDGNIPFVAYSPGHDITLRVSIVPVAHGEKAVMRILDPKRNLIELEDMGFSDLALSQYRQKIHSPYGMILHVGPTGSGKTTTLYAALNEINDPELNIHTIENPIEYTLPGVNQLEIRHEIGLDFARALRAYLRQDPDVILVGEIRDEETAHVAVEASMTGHLLFSTLHTNDAATTVVRLLEMGIKPYMISSSLLVICAQRLLRRLCMTCRRPYEADIGVKHMLGMSGDQKLILYAAGGCEACNHTGYSGRIGIFELLVPNDTLRQVMNQPHVSAEQIKDAAIRFAGMRTLFQDAADKTIQGLTSLEEMTLQILPDEATSGSGWQHEPRRPSPYPIPKITMPVPFGRESSREASRNVVVY